jgi:hypothetical protein
VELNRDACPRSLPPTSRRAGGSHRRLVRGTSWLNRCYAATALASEDIEAEMLCHARQRSDEGHQPRALPASRRIEIASRRSFPVRHDRL